MADLPLTGGLTAEVPDALYPVLANRRWRTIVIRGNPYPVRAETRDGRRQWIYLHAEVWTLLHGPVPEGYMIDHIDGKTLRATNDNLRLVTHSQNSMNRRKRAGCSSRFKGVNWHTVHHLWRARIKVNGKECSLGYYKQEEDAAIAYNEAALKFFGRYARFNDVPMPAEFWRAVEETRRGEHAALVVLDAGHTDWHMRDACAAGLAVVEGVAP